MQAVHQTSLPSDSRLAYLFWKPTRARFRKCKLGSKTHARFKKRLEGSSPSPSVFNVCALGRAAKVPAFQAGEAGSTPAGYFEFFEFLSIGDRLAVG